MKWIPVTERLPKNEDYILVSFENSTMPDIARYEENNEGGTFYPGDDEVSYSNYGLFVNAWMPLPEPYSADTEKPQTNADRIRSMTDKELASVVMCPADITGGDTECDQHHNCNECTFDWLQRESEG